MMRRWLPFLWYGLIFATSCTVVHRGELVAVVPEPGRAGFDAMWTHAWWIFVKGWHMTEFGVLLLLLRRTRVDMGWALFLTSLGATLDEFHQTFVPGRGGVVSDVLIDVAGALVAAGILFRREAQRTKAREITSAENDRAQPTDTGDGRTSHRPLPVAPDFVSNKALCPTGGAEIA